MGRISWTGVIPAVTTPFDPEGGLDLPAFDAHCRWMIDSGCAGVVVGGSLGEGASLDAPERTALLRTAEHALARRAPVIAAVGAIRTSDAVDLARAAASDGAAGLLLLPPYVYRGDPREIREHFGRLLRGTDLPCMLYNNPGAYGTDVLPDRLLELATEHPTLEAVKESGPDVRRIAAVRALLGERLAVSVGTDDQLIEGVAGGATGWIAGVANAFPAESVELWRRANTGPRDAALAWYRWFLPLLRMDASPKLVQLIKLQQTEVGRGTPRVRPPRLELADEERALAVEAIRHAIATRPAGASPAARRAPASRSHRSPASPH